MNDADGRALVRELRRLVYILGALTAVNVAAVVLTFAGLR